MKFHVMIKTLTTDTYEVEANSPTEARAKFIDDGGRFVSSEEDATEIADVELVEEFKSHG